MEKRHPNRKRAKENPYYLYEKEGQTYVSFKDGEGMEHTIKISKELYEAFDTFELEDIRHLNAVSRHIEHSELWDETLNRRAFWKPERIDEVVFYNLLVESLRTAILALSDKLRRRLTQHYFDNMTYKEIADREKCSVRAVEYCIHAALQNLRKYFK